MINEDHCVVLDEKALALAAFEGQRDPEAPEGPAVKPGPRVKIILDSGEIIWVQIPQGAKVKTVSVVT
jgi:hypothetical protein